MTFDVMMSLRAQRDRLVLSLVLSLLHNGLSDRDARWDRITRIERALTYLHSVRLIREVDR